MSLLIPKAIHFATQLHKRQTRWPLCREPLINHPIKIAYLVSEAVPNEIKGDIVYDMICASYLHNVIEDCNLTYQDIMSKLTRQDIAKEFNSQISDLVFECTNNRNLTKWRK